MDVKTCRERLGDQVADLTDEELREKIRRFSILVDIILDEAQRQHARHRARSTEGGE